MFGEAEGKHAMSKASRRPNREARKKKQKAEKDLRRQERAAGMEKPRRATPANRKSDYGSVEEETEARNHAVSEQHRVMQSLLPTLLRRLVNIPDPRNPKKTKHKLTSLMIYGILTFVYQMSSRRVANKKMTRAMFTANLMSLFPDLETMPHHDTLQRLLARIDVNGIEGALIEMIRKLIEKKKFKSYLINHCYPIAIDGTQKFERDECWSEECQQREIKRGEETIGFRYYVYVVEASLSFRNGLVVPFMSEFLDYTEGDPASDKQDCEQRGFKRLAERLKKEFPRLRIMVLLDGLYPNGPITEICRKNKWQFMIVLKDKSLPCVWEEARGLKKLQPDNIHRMTWGNRTQDFWWVNDIEHWYDDGRAMQVFHVVVCEETWREVDKEGEIINKSSRHAWVSSEPLNHNNLHERCNLGARHRWGIESDILVEKCHGYRYEHCFSYDWTATRGYHFLMRIGVAINVLAMFTEHLAKLRRNQGLAGFVEFLRETIAAPWLTPQTLQALPTRTPQLRLTG